MFADRQNLQPHMRRKGFSLYHEEKIKTPSRL